jgi:hypothetical protein
MAEAARRQTTGSSPRRRSVDLDLFKMLLVWGMVAAHCFELLTETPHPLVILWSETADFYSFTGFMLAFGIGVGLQGGSSSRPLLLRLRPALLLLLATFVSEIAYDWGVERAPLNWALFRPLLSLSHLYGWSEFLATFFVLYLVIAVARPVLVWLAQWPWIVLAIAACLASTLVVVDKEWPLIATVVGTTRFASFPLLSYLPWFLIGIFVGRRGTIEPTSLLWLGACVATAIYVYVIWQAGEEPSRFPPSWVWIIGPGLPLAFLLAFSHEVAHRVPLPAVLLGPGRHVLGSLLLSNLVIFGTRRFFGFRFGAPLTVLLSAVGLIALVTLFALLLDRVPLPRPFGDGRFSGRETAAVNKRR